MGLFEQLLVERYGPPTHVARAQFVEYRWNDNAEPLRCVLFKAVRLPAGLRPEDPDLNWVYGDAAGGLLLLDSLKIAMPLSVAIYGLYTIDELQAQPEVLEAKRLDRDINYFMDSANVWFYGMKEQNMYVYDSETGDLTALGPVEQALRQVLREWEVAKSSSG
jgi:hypothetical protein